MRDLGVTLGILVDKYAVLDARDDDNGVEEAKGLLVALRDQIGMGHE
jgi:hypothetical protein